MITEFLIALTPAWIPTPAVPAGAPAHPAMQQQTVHAPDLIGLEWLNTDRPFASWKEDLKGQVVLLDFWTYCCINCLHVLPDLAELEEEFREEPFLVIGVHSAKFEQESDAKNIRQAILRYGIKHPVVVDGGMRIWRSFGVRAWPTLVLVDPEGYVVGYVSGEGNKEVLRRAIRSVLDEHREKGTLAEAPIRPELMEMPETKLAFPGKVHVYRDRLYVADSSRNRVLELDLGSGAVLREFPEAGSSVTFANPQGMAGLDDHLYVADTDHHQLQRIHLESGIVETVAGTGVQARPLPEAGPARETPLNSPWALEVDGKLLHIAMAGSHQLWSFDTVSGELLPLAGSGRENIVDGPSAQAQLAQPSGLALLDGRLYFADSEVSAIRYVDLEEEEVGTLVGTGLFDFGDEDGEMGDALLQHPLGVAVWKGSLLIADTYNNRIKLLDLEEGTARALFGTGSEELSEDELSFYEPGGLAVSGDTLYVADTNHHRILAVDLGSGAWRVLLGG